MFRKYIDRWKRKQFYNAPLDTPDGKEAALINELKSTFRNLPPLHKELHDQAQTWVDFRTRLRNDVQNQDPRDFTCWPPIMESMYCIPKKVEFQKVKDHPRIKDLKTKNWGRPMLYPGLHVDENTVHHFYVMNFLLEKVKDLNQFDHIVEFGGGYGNVCSVLTDLGFKGDYTIFDLPEFSAFQKFYLAGNDYLSRNPKIQFSNDLDDFKSKVSNYAPQKTLFIGTWSISETPLELREQVMPLITAENFFICYQGVFEDIDNKAYFNELKTKHPNLNWTESQFEHLKNSHCLIGLS